MKILPRFGAFIAAFLLIGCLPARAQQQTILASTNTPIFSSGTSCASTLKSASIFNIGQTTHVVNYVLGGLTGEASPTVELMGSFDNAAYAQISSSGVGQAGQVASLIGYGTYPFLQVWVVNGSTGCTIAASYLGAQVSPTNPGGSADVTSYQQIIFNAIPAGSGLTPAAFNTPYGSMGGFLLATYSGTPVGGSTITLDAVDAPSAIGAPIAKYTLTTAPGVQIFAVPPAGASGYTITYTPGGAATATLTLDYIFLKPGATQNPIGEKIAVVNTAAAGPTTIITPTGGESIRITGINLSSATAEAIDLQQGTGTNCGTGNSQLTGLVHLGANGPWIQNFPGGGLVALPGNSVCIHLSAANQTDGFINHSDF